MSALMVRALLCLLLPLAGLSSADAQARTASARIARITTGIGTLERVRVTLDWPQGAAQGRLTMHAARIDAPDLGYRLRDVHWQCPLHRRGADGWQCRGSVRAGSGGPATLEIALDPRQTSALFSQGDARLRVQRSDAAPDLTRVDLTRVPLAWTQALLAQAWPEARLTAGRADAALSISARAPQPLRISGPLALSGASLDTPDGTVAAEGLGARLAIDVKLGSTDEVAISGRVLGGELLFGSTYAALGNREVGLDLQAIRDGEGGWRLPHWRWSDAGVLDAKGTLALAREAALQSLEADFSSADLAALAPAYLSGWLGAAGLGEMKLAGRARGRVVVRERALHSASLELDADIHDPRGRFVFDGLAGDLRFSAGVPERSELRWRGGGIYGVRFGPARLPMSSAGGSLEMLQDIALPMLGGTARFERLRLRPPMDGQGTDVQFGLALDGLDVAKLAETLGWPAFTGQLSGRIPQARYSGNRLVFDGGLDMGLFGGRVAVSSLEMERPFGVAPTLSADVTLDDLDLEALTGVLGFGEITGRLDGRIAGLRLMDWQPVAFDARLHSDRAAARRDRVRQRISQRAVQDLSSVGDASLMTSLQSQLIGLFDDFGYSRIGISCRLVDEVCAMDGLGSAGPAFIIVQGSGLPRLAVVGFNRRVDWPMLVERLSAVGKGDVKPMVD